MKFEYEISVNDSVAAQLLYYKLTTGNKRFERASFWLFGGIFFIFIAYDQPVFNWAPILLAATGAKWIYAAFRILFPGRYFRGFYQRDNLSGRKFQANLNEEGLEVNGDLCSWRAPWRGVSVKGEDKSVFMLYVEGTLFIFGKKYLTDEQQHELRRLAAIS